MRITKFGHACVRLEYDGQVIVLDPGGFTEPEAVDGATVVLITHQHPDHLDVDRLRRADAPVYTIAAVAELLPDDLRERTTVVTPGSTLDVGVPVDVVGEKHAIIHPELPHFDNSGYLLTLGDTRIYHPGDSLTLPGQDIDVLLLPVSAPWLKVSECIDFGREVGAPRNVGIHDAVYSEIGHGIVGGQLTKFLGDRGQSYVRLSSGQDL